jgi:aryl-alcohol dehydrogenase-like predicted oxidoreductase
LNGQGNRQADELAEIARELACSPAQLALAWCTKNPYVATVVTGASSTAQIAENMQALDVVPLLTSDIMGRIDRIFPVSS